MKGSHRNQVMIDKGVLVGSKSGDTVRGTEANFDKTDR